MEVAELLRSLSQGRLHSAELPETVELGAIGIALDGMYQQSARDLRERSALLLLGSAGQVRPSPIIVGESHRASIEALEPDPDCRVVGLMHTHPPHEGAVGIAFSEQDFATMINSIDLFSLMQTGRNVMAMARTEKTASYTDIASTKQQMIAVEKAALADGYTPKEALVLSNLVICSLYGLALYVGYAPGPLQEVFRP